IQASVLTLQPMLEELLDRLLATEAVSPGAEPCGAEIQRAASQVREDYRWVLAVTLDAVEKIQERTREIGDAIKGELAPPVFDSCDLNRTAILIAGALGIVADRAGVSLRLDLDASLPLAELDSKQIYNALYNL